LVDDISMLYGLLKTRPYAGENKTVQSGWGYIVGDGTSALAAAITFPTAFDDDEVSLVVCGSRAKATAAGVPTSAGDGSSYSLVAGGYQTLTKTGATVYIKDFTYNFSASYYHTFTWIAIGTKAR
jgi:hypothetical protein